MMVEMSGMIMMIMLMVMIINVGVGHNGADDEDGDVQRCGLRSSLQWK